MPGATSDDREDLQPQFRTRISRELMDEIEAVCSENGWKKNVFLERALRSLQEKQG
jgi:hypothetical protein|tara:strand:+ start:1603 stop:1770 length:168 start_codon:yes stop_codon:yes gene_type:complete